MCSQCVGGQSLFCTHLSSFTGCRHLPLKLLSPQKEPSLPKRKQRAFMDRRKVLGWNREMKNLTFVLVLLTRSVWSQSTS